MSIEEHKLSDDIREAVKRANKRGFSRYAIANTARIHQSAMCRFMSGERGLELAALDRLGAVLGLRVIENAKGAKKGR